MSGPRDDLASQLQQLADAQDVQVNVYAAPPAILAVPALVIRPDTPWRQPGQNIPFPHTGERYAVVAVVQAGGDPGDSVDTLRELAQLVELVGSPWQWTATDGVVQTSEGGIDYLAATARTTYMEG